MDAPYNLKKFNTSSIKLNKIKVKFDLNTLDLIIAFIYKDSVLKTRKTLTNINRFMDSVDTSLYEYDPITKEEAVDLKARLWIIKKSLMGRLNEGLTDPNTLMTYCLDDVECNNYIKSVILDIPNKKISHDESKFLIRKIDDALEFGYVVTIKNIMQDLLNKVDDEEFKSYKSIEDDLYSIATSVINIRRHTRSLGSDETFSLDSDIFEQVVEDAVQKLKDRNRIFITGIRRLNTILSPGYMSKRLYLYLAFPGKGKSMMLLKSALDIRKYNSTIKTKDPDKRPAVLFLTLENDIAETIERLYNMTVDSDDIRNYTPKQIKTRMKKEGHLTLSDDNNIDIIIKEYKNREIDTNDIYSIIDDYSDDGVEIIALVLDYIKRVRPAEQAESEKEELKNVSNELKEIAKSYDIPVNNIAA